MTIWEKIIVNIEKASQRITATAALLSERVRAEVAIIRLRVRLNEIRSLIHEQEQLIGRRIVELKRKDGLPEATDQLLIDEGIVTALAEITSREKDLEDIYNEIANEHAAFKAAERANGEAA